MKRKNVQIGGSITAKNTHGGAGCGDVFFVGQAYEVIHLEPEDYKEDKLTVRVAGSAEGSLWVNPKHFRKGA